MMNPGVGEEAGSTARTLIEAMKSQPALLAMIIANIALLVFMFYALHGAAEYRDKLTSQVLTNSAAIHEMLTQRSVTCPEK
jgi:hypothetical protein